MLNPNENDKINEVMLGIRNVLSRPFLINITLKKQQKKEIIKSITHLSSFSVKKMVDIDPNYLN